MRRFFLGIVVLATGCTSMTSMQTGRVTPEGDFRLIIGGGLFRTPELSPSDPSQITYPYVEAAARFGFTEGWDIGARYTFPGMLSGDVKFCPYEDDVWAFSLGVGGGYMAIDAEDDPTSKFFTKPLVDVYFPAYISYDFDPAFGVYASPRFVLRYLDKTQNLLGAAVGVRIGNYVGVMLEVSAASDLRSDYSQMQFGAGFFFGSASSVPGSKDGGGGKK